MTLFAIFALMTGVAVLFALAPLGSARSTRSRTASGETLYREQLEAIERDEAAGVSTHAEAEAARAEIARRVMADRPAPAAAGGTRSASGWAAVVLAFAVPAIALPVYLSMGQPNLPGGSTADRIRQLAQNSDVAELVAKVENHLAADPNDAEGWKVLAPVYMRMGRYDAAADAYRNTIRLSGPNAELQADLGEAIAASAGGVITAEARVALQEALKADPGAAKPRFLLAVAAEQDGDWAEATARWSTLLRTAPTDAPWRSEVQERLAAATAKAGGKGPTSQDVAAAEDMAPEDRTAMIEGMVGRLADRLAEDGDDLDGWLQLARAYVVLGRIDEARAAIDSAEKNFPEEAGRIAEASRRLGIGS